MKDSYITIIETQAFTHGKHAISEVDLDVIKLTLARNPQAGTIIPHSGGVRKLRIAKNKGRRSGYRVIYYFYNLHNPLYLFAIYAKNVKHDLTQRELKELKKIVTELKNTLKQGDQS